MGGPELPIPKVAAPSGVEVTDDLHPVGGAYPEAILSGGGSCLNSVGGAGAG